MKKLLLSICALAMFASDTNAQAPDMGFETWAAIAPPFVTTQDPQGWASLNALTAVGGTQSAFKETTSVAAGTASAKLVTVKIPSGTTIPNPYGGNLDTAGILAVGKISVSPVGFQYGYGPYANRPAVLTFQSKYTPMPGDSAFVLAYITHFNAGPQTRDTLGSGKYATGATTTAYASHTVNMTYKTGAFMGIQADSVQIFISSSVYSHDGAKIGSAFYIDDLVWSGYVSTSDIDGVMNNVSVYPNPADGSINIECTVESQMVEVMDIAGRKMGSYAMESNKAAIQTNHFAKGFYIYQVTDKEGKVINRGKFEVAH